MEETSHSEDNLLLGLQKGITYTMRGNLIGTTFIISYIMEVSYNRLI